MTTAAALRDLDATAALLAEHWVGALRGASAGADADVRAMSADGLVTVVETLGALARHVEALQARCAAELSARSRSGDDADPTRRHGFSSPERLIAQATGRHYRDAARLVAVGEATAGRSTLTGELMPARHPHLAEALVAGRVCVDAADAIRTFLDRVSLRADRADLDAAEAMLVERAPSVGVEGLARLIARLEASLDPDGVKPREDELRSRRSLKIWQDAAGMINLRGAFDPVNGAPIKVAIEALVGAELRAARDARPSFGEPGAGEVGAGEVGAGEADALVAEQRSIDQLNADALADIARHSLSSADGPTALRGVTVVARVDARSLVSGHGYGHGHATIDGIDHPISVQSARELALAAGIAPLLMSERGEPLDLGRSARLFTPAQKLALAARDGGCAWPGCTRPPSHAEAHHVAWWGRDDGPSDVANGILLCSHHHHRVHDDGWRIRIHEGRSWFIPPVHLDPAQRPRPGNVALDRDIDRALGRRRGEPMQSQPAAVAAA